MRISWFQYGVFFCLAAGSPHAAAACGWWGDGEVNRDAIAIDVGGMPSIPPGVEATKIPGERGYGVAVFQPRRAIPYLRATQGQPAERIDQLKDFGFVTVIDLGPPLETARRHEAETEATGMRYINIPVVGDIPTDRQIQIFSTVIGTASNRPLVVYSPKTTLLGNMWALHRLHQGALHGTALGEGAMFGVSRNLEEILTRP